MKTLIYIIMFLMSGIWLSSCRSIQHVPVETVRTEIKYEKGKDSLRIIDKVNTRDSIRLKDSIVTTVNDKGDVIRTEIWHWKEKYSDVNSLYERLQSKYDSLYSAKQDSIQVPYPVEKQLSRWQTIKQEIGGIAIGVIVAMLFIIVWLIRRKK
ncbi:hypothetical protein [Bacteroides ovatus]|uniref:hypothetical protein n=1 Tax=Bacteroides ovatus TaxID=28116 RepID=UPI0018CB270F|nr:hypothetical protein [Bacteroides ovatus]MBG9217333.1 hypothetical protein [Bacteroides ovatus]MBG9233084.1 hypothetical protein [Bacteroides ovatus]